MAAFPSIERSLKTLHSWLGVMILPWVVILGMTGFYLNHWRAVDRLLTTPGYDESQFDAWPDPHEQSLQGAFTLAEALWPHDTAFGGEQTVYHGRLAWSVSAGRNTLILDAATGHYWTKTRFTRKTFDPDGNLLHKKIYWGSLLKTLHERGWIDARLGTWLADITALAMVVFGLSGLFLFTAPRLRRRKNRLARSRMQAPASRP